MLRRPIESTVLGCHSQGGRDSRITIYDFLPALFTAALSILADTLWGAGGYFRAWHLAPAPDMKASVSR
jgi:hypothetical protein